ncbi:MAG TPA: ABC transporter substrate-binding protein, partial [Casimicrobiaceae bacterium]|nr:ABC transporter substrate-binding protein [Casimicrobiaceae bacterium]
MPIAFFRQVVAIALCAAALLTGANAALAAADMNKVLRVASNDITSLDPQQGTDLYSTRVTSAIFEALYEFEYLSTGSKVIPNTAESMPVVTDDGKTWTMRMRKGIHFTDDPAFKGRKRELVAADYVYSIKRALDPNLRTGGDPALTDLIIGARPVVDAARKAGGKFNYDAPIVGLQAADRYTLVLRLARPDYTMLERLAGLQMMAVAREAIEAAGSDVMSRPVGTGPYRLKEWRRASRVVLEANPDYRAVRFPENADAPQQDLVHAMRGKTIPRIGRIEISIIEESQPEFLAFTQGDLDLIALGGDATRRVMENGKLRPDLASRGIRHVRFGSPSITFTYFNLDDPAVGGYSTQQIALRRAIGMGFDVDEMIRVLFAGNGLPANQLLPPGVSGHDPTLPPKS